MCAQWAIFFSSFSVSLFSLWSLFFFFSFLDFHSDIHPTSLFRHSLFIHSDPVFLSFFIFPSFSFAFHSFSHTLHSTTTHNNTEQHTQTQACCPPHLTLTKTTHLLSRSSFIPAHILRSHFSLSSFHSISQPRLDGHSRRPSATGLFSCHGPLLCLAKEIPARYCWTPLLLLHRLLARPTFSFLTSGHPDDA